MNLEHEKLDDLASDLASHIADLGHIKFSEMNEFLQSRLDRLDGDDFLTGEHLDQPHVHVGTTLYGPVSEQYVRTVETLFRRWPVRLMIGDPATFNGGEEPWRIAWTGKHPSGNNDVEPPLDLTAFRSRRAALKTERRRQRARDSLLPEAPDNGREIPPRINPDVPDMVDQVKGGYFDLTQAIQQFQEWVADLAAARDLDPRVRAALVAHYRHLLEAVDAATAATLQWSGTGHSTYDITEHVQHVADHAKYVYAIGSRDIASLQYRLAAYAHVGLLAVEAHERLQWDHCHKMWETLYNGTVCAVRDDRMWDGGWDWCDNTYSDGRQVMSQVRVKNWDALERNLPFAGIAGDGPCDEHPWGSVCSIAPVIDPDEGHYRCYQPIEIDLEAFMDQVDMQALTRGE
jgi:hypothetical protein